MLKIRKFACEHLTQGCVTDEAAPRFSFSVDSDRQGVTIAKAVVSVNGWTCRDGEELRSFLTTFAAPDRGYEIISGGAEPDAVQRVREAFDSADILYTEASE